MKKLAALLLLAGLALTTDAQVSTLLDPGKDGVMIAPCLDFGKGYNGAGMSVGFSLDGSIEFQGDFTHTNFDQAFGLTNDDAYCAGVTSAMTWWAFRKDVLPVLDVNLGVKGGFDSHIYKNFKYWSEDSANFDEYNSFYGGKLGVEANTSYWLSERWFIQPSFTIYGEVGLSNRMIDGAEINNTYVGVKGIGGVLIARRIFVGSTLFARVSQTYNTYGIPPNLRIQLGYVMAF